MQVQYLDKRLLTGLAQWLKRRWQYCQEKKHKAMAEIESSGISREVLEEQWARQVSEQTKPIPRASFRPPITLTHQ